MTTSEIDSYIKTRYAELCMDEILHIVDTERNPQINHIIYENNIWQIWTDKGDYFTFKKRSW